MKGKIIKRKQVGVMITAILLVISMSTMAFAEGVHTSEWHNVSTEFPKDVSDEGISTYGLGRPSTDSYVDLNQKELTFAGYAQGSTLYTNKHFKGKSSIGYSITNYSDTKLTVKFYTSSGWFKSKKITVEGKATLTGTIDGLDNDKLYYLTFSAPSDFAGSVY